MRECSDRTGGRLWYCGRFTQHEALPLARKYLAGQQLSYREKQKLLLAFDLNGDINAPFRPDVHPRYSEDQFALFADEIRALLIGWIRRLEPEAWPGASGPGLD